MEIQKKAEQLLELRQKAEELKKQLDQIKFKKDEIQNSLMDEMKQEGFNSVKVDKTMVSKAVRKTMVISDENALIAELKEKGLDKEYVREQVDKTLWRGLSTSAIKEGVNFKGTEIKETEFISIRTNK